MVLPASGCSLWQSWEWGCSLDSSFACSHGLALPVRCVRGHEDGTKLGGVADMPDVCSAVWRNELTGAS